MTHHHDYTELSNTSEATIEICRECKKKLVTKKDSKGRIDNATYLAEHIRDTAQPNGRTGDIFKKYYGRKSN